VNSIALGAPVGRPRLRVSDVFRQHGRAFAARHPLTADQGRVLGALIACRTAQLGGHLERCDRCDYERPVYNSCRNRHCPGCQALAQRDWIDGRLRRVLPVHHFHVVFTLPAELRPLAQRNAAIVFTVLVRSAARVLATLGKQRLGATLGVTTVLHTWTRQMLFHPHVHCVVTGGGLALDGTSWVGTPRHFLFPVAVMRALFRRLVREALLDAFDKGELDLGGACADLADRTAFRRMLRGLRRKHWVVYCKPPFAGAEGVFRYLGRYTHRVAISDQRVVAVTDEAVTFRTRGEQRCTVSPDEFVRRFLLHVLPARFHKMRHFGLYASGSVNGKLPIAAALCPPAPAPRPAEIAADGAPSAEAPTKADEPQRCPCCEQGRIVRIELGRSTAAPLRGTASPPAGMDTS